MFAQVTTPTLLRTLFGCPTAQPDEFGSYVLEAELGRGGMGVVYGARHRAMGRRAALKVLPEGVDPVALERFEREVRRTAFLRHPSTVTVYDYGRSRRGLFYYAMELVEGHDLATLVEREGPMDPRRVVGVLRDIAGALAEAHGQGLVHRDIKPANLMLTPEPFRRDQAPERAMLLDFGLVREPDGELGVDDDVITGTPHYLAPEAVRTPTEVDGRADLYSLGASAYYLLTGRHVFQHHTATLAICAAHLTESVIPPSYWVDVPEALETLVMQLLAKDPYDRPASAEALLDALDGLSLGDPSSDDTRAWWASAVAHIAA